MPKLTRRALLGGASASFVAAFASNATLSAPQSLVDSVLPLAVGTWYLNANGYQLTLTISDNSGQYFGTIINDTGGTDSVSNITFDGTTLIFLRTGAGFWQWYRLTIVEGVLAGKFSHSDSTSEEVPPGPSYLYHATGWNSSYFDTDIVPRVFDVTLNTNFLGTLRIDRNPDGSFAGRLKVYANTFSGAGGEELEDDLQNIAWDGINLSFQRVLFYEIQYYTGTVSGRYIAGTFTTSSESGTYPWQGTRSNVLTYGLVAKSSDDRSAWQASARAMLMCLMMSGNPSPQNFTITTLNLNAPPLPDGPIYGTLDRDDNPAAWPRNYRLCEFDFTYNLYNSYGSDPIVRRSHAFLAIPNAPPPAGGYRAVVAVNGHPGVYGASGAWDMMNPTDGDYWYGDAFARRGYVVLALDISHRPPLDSSPLYSDYPNGNDPAHGNGPHPAIQASELPHNTIWEEDGERTWDVMRAVDLLLSGQLGVMVDPNALILTGLSLGGEVTAIAGAFDTRFAVVIPASFTANFSVIKYHGNHPCWQWQHADVTEYIDVSDYHALVAPRALIPQTGSQDNTFSSFNPPFATAKEVVRRSMVAYTDAPSSLIHYFQPWLNGELVHQYRVGDTYSSGQQRIGVQVPVIMGPPPIMWQTDGKTQTVSIPGHITPSLFDCIDYFLVSLPRVQG